MLESFIINLLINQRDTSKLVSLNDLKTIVPLKNVYLDTYQYINRLDEIIYAYRYLSWSTIYYYITKNYEVDIDPTKIRKYYIYVLNDKVYVLSNWYFRRGLMLQIYQNYKSIDCMNIYDIDTLRKQLILLPKDIQSAYESILTLTIL